MSTALQHVALISKGAVMKTSVSSYMFAPCQSVRYLLCLDHPGVHCVDASDAG